MVEVTPPSPIAIPVTNVEPPVVEQVVAYRGFAAEVGAIPSTNSSPGIVGRVALRGTPPLEAVPEGSNRPPCLDLQGNPPVNPLFKVGNDGSLADVIVAITAGLEGKRFPTPLTNHLWTITNCQIYPLVSVVRTVQRIGFVSTDAQSHVMQFISAAGSNLGTRVGNSIRVEERQKLTQIWPPMSHDLLQLKCLQHPWETAAVAVYAHPFFAVTDTNGNFVIPRVPAGKYTLRATHRGLPGTNEITQLVTVKSDEISVVNFTIDSPTWKASLLDPSAQAAGGPK